MTSKVFFLTSLASLSLLAACQSAPEVPADVHNPLAVQEAVDVLYTSAGKSWREFAAIKGVHWSAEKPVESKNQASLSGLLVDAEGMITAEGSPIRVNKVKFSRPAVQSNADLLRSLFNENVELKAVTVECSSARAATFNPAFYELNLDGNPVYAQAMVMAGGQGPVTELSFTRYRPNEEINKYECK